MELQTLFRRESAAGCSSERVMAFPLFRVHNNNLAGWKTGSRKIVGLKMAVL
jgi:hypothetical protein